MYAVFPHPLQILFYRINSRGGHPARPAAGTVAATRSSASGCVRGGGRLRSGGERDTSLARRSAEGSPTNGTPPRPRAADRQPQGRIHPRRRRDEERTHTTLGDGRARATASRRHRPSAVVVALTDHKNERISSTTTGRRVRPARARAGCACGCRESASASAAAASRARAGDMCGARARARRLRRAWVVSGGGRLKGLAERLADEEELVKRHKVVERRLRSA